MEDQTVTVLGGTGFLGSTIVRHLSRQGYSVRVAARHPQTAMFSDLEGSIQPVACDIQDEQSVIKAVADTTAVVNAVSLYVEKGPLTFEAIHVDGAERVARCVEKAAVERLVHVSGIGASTASPSSYVRARARGEQVVRTLLGRATIIRPSVLCAPGAGFIAPLKAVTRLPIVPLFGRGDTRLQPVYVNDIAQAVGGLLARPETKGQVFELGGGKIYSYREALEAVMEHYHRKRLLMPFPFPLWHALATVLGLLPNPPLTRDQVYLVQADNVVGYDVGTFGDLGLQPASLEDILAKGPSGE